MSSSPACIAPSVRTQLLGKLNRSDVRLIVSGHLHQHRDREVGGHRHLWTPAVAFAAPQAHGGDGRCGLAVLDFSQNGVEVTIERPHGLISHDLAAIKGHGRYHSCATCRLLLHPTLHDVGSRAAIEVGLVVGFAPAVRYVHPDKPRRGLPRAGSRARAVAARRPAAARRYSHLGLRGGRILGHRPGTDGAACAARARTDAAIGNRRAAHGAQARSVRANPQYDEGRRDGGLRIEASMGTIRTPLSAACATGGIRRSRGRRSRRASSPRSRARGPTTGERR